MTARRRQTNGDDPRFFDFFYPRDPIHPYGVYEKGMPHRYVEVIDEIACRWSKTSSATGEERWHGRYRDCLIADDWAKELCRANVPALRLGEMGDNKTTRCLSGYQTTTGLTCHFWVVIGRRQLVFDPTVSQFHFGGICQIGEAVDRGGVSLDRYEVDGRSFLDARRSGVQWVE